MRQQGQLSVQECEMRLVMISAIIALFFASSAQAKSFSSQSNRGYLVSAMLQQSNRHKVVTPVREIMRSYGRDWDDDRGRSNNRGNHYGHDDDHGPRFPVPRRPRNCSPH